MEAVAEERQAAVVEQRDHWFEISATLDNGTTPALRGGCIKVRPWYLPYPRSYRRRRRGRAGRPTPGTHDG